MLLLYLQYQNKGEKLTHDISLTLASEINILHFTTRTKSSYSKVLKYFLHDAKSLLELKSWYTISFSYFHSYLEEFLS